MRITVGEGAESQSIELSELNLQDEKVREQLAEQIRKLSEKIPDDQQEQAERKPESTP